MENLTSRKSTHKGRNKISIEISSWITFAIALSFYWITADPDVSYWDCPEYVTIASKMEVGHPPGNPIWMLAMRVATIPFSSEHHAYVINLCSGIFMAFAAFFLCRIIYSWVRLSFYKKKYLYDTDPLTINCIVSIISIGASLCFALCDSTWFSAVEAEVYAMSAFLTSLSLWIMVLWWKEKSQSKRYRLLILLAYLTGLSLGVHQLNLLLIPVFLLIVLYKKRATRINLVLVWLLIISACLLIAFILMILIPGLLYGAESFELFGVNILGLPYNSGVLIFTILVLAFIIISLILTNPIPKSSFPHLLPINIIIWMGGFLLLGFSSFGMIMIRAQAAPLMNEGTPDNIFALTSYIKREQYPSVPLLYGQTPYSRPMFEETFINNKPYYSRYLLEKGKGIYQPYIPEASLYHRCGMLSHKDSTSNMEIMESQHGYILSDYKFSQKMTPELNMWFPRITSRNISDRKAYEDWGGMTEENMDRVAISETIDSLGNAQPRLDMWGHRTEVFSYKPTYYQNLKYFISYQAYYMYFRYLFWNFIGRQNDFHSQGEIDHGNFVTGFSFIDNTMIGSSDYYPKEIWESNKGRNRYFAIPFIFGLIGIVWLLSGNRENRRMLAVITLFFFMTGLAIVIYLNQTPGEPRERDYTFLGSYMAFCMWIAAGLTCLSHIFLRFLSMKIAVCVTCLICLGIPTLMAIENFDDHDRRNRFETSFYASSLLDFEYPAIIFSHGDNSSFPLWYASEVLQKGKDHTPVDITYLSLPSYTINLKKQGNKGLQTLAPTSEIAYGKYLLVQIPPDSLSVPLPLTDVLKTLYQEQEAIPVLTTSLVKIPKSPKDSLVINLHEFTNGGKYLSFKHLMLLDILASQNEANNPKILFFPYLIDHSFYKPLDGLLKPTLFGKIYSPYLTDSLYMDLMKRSVGRELTKLSSQDIKPHYIDPVIADRSVRYRGELILAAQELYNNGDSILPLEIMQTIEEALPYSTLLPGTFTLEDSTFYEGKEYLKLLQRIYTETPQPGIKKSMENLDSIMKNRNMVWLNYYQSLNPAQRRAISNRSKRLLIK